MPVFISLCSGDFGCHSGCGDDWRCWLHLRRRTPMFVQSPSQTDCLASTLSSGALQKAAAPILLLPLMPHLWKATHLEWYLVYFHRRGCRDPTSSTTAVRGCRRPWKHGRKKKFPINSGNWYKLCCFTIQSPLLLYWRPTPTHTSDSTILCFRSTANNLRFLPLPQQVRLKHTPSISCRTEKN